MSFGRATAIGALAGLCFALVLAILGSAMKENGIYAGLVFVAMKPLFDIIALAIGGDGGPRVFWAAASWTVLALAPGMTGHLSSAGRPDGFGQVEWPTEIWVLVLGVLAGVGGAVLRELRLRGTTFRRVQPLLAIAATLFVGGTVAEHTWNDHAGYGHWQAEPDVPGVALLGLAIAIVILVRMMRGLGDRGEDGKWLHGTMTADGVVTIDGYPPMHAPKGTPHRAGVVIVELGERPAATFRTTDAPKILRIKQGLDADLDGSRTYRREGESAYATAAALLPAAAAYAAFMVER